MVKIRVPSHHAGKVEEVRLAYAFDLFLIGVGVLGIPWSYLAYPSTGRSHLKELFMGNVICLSVLK
ncbi:MAG: hypothetical protein GSR79_07765 [Desulfurococcales archaeon]|nr:hypothetical protein [Desulfurococcales archaeon]